MPSYGRRCLRCPDSLFAHDEAIPIKPVIDALPADADVVLTTNGRRVVTTGLVPALRRRLDAGETHIQPPFPGPDLPFHGGFVWDGWSTQRLLDRTKAIFLAAMQGYEALATGLFASLAPWMQTAVTLPAVLHGYLDPGHREEGWAGAPTIVWWLEALSIGQTSCVQIAIEHEDRREEQFAEFRGTALQARALRPRQARWLDATMHSSILDVFELWSAQELVYDWIWDDLKRIKWVDGNLGNRPTGFGL